MSDFNNALNDSFKEAVSIEAQRIFDSCSDRDCLDDLQVRFGAGYDLDDNITVVKARCVDVANVCVSVEPVPFNKGFFSVDITYTFHITFDAFRQACGPAVTTLTGTAVFTKKVILFGSEGNAKTFTSTGNSTGTTNPCCEFISLPKATVSVVQPICLNCRIVSKCGCGFDKDNDGCMMDKKPNSGKREVLVTLGLFSIVQLSRPVAILIPAFDYCVPHKECSANADSPCEMFDKIKFPSDEFFPPALDSINNGDCDCGCGQNF